MPRKPKAKKSRALPAPGAYTAPVQRFPHSSYGVEANDVPDFIEPFVAYRAWNWTEVSITSLNNVPWVPKVAFEAICNRIDMGLSLSPHVSSAQAQEIEDDLAEQRRLHPVPDPGCTCGMYAGINMQHLIDIGYIERGLHGEVYLWGRLFRHTLGWRAQYAYPKNFVVPRNMLPFEIRTFQQRMEILIAFDVDIYLQTDKEPHVGQVNLPLWMKDYGYSQAGLDYILAERSQWKPPQVEGMAVGDRIAVLHDKGGIGIVKKIEGDDIYYNLFGTVLHRIRMRDTKWNSRNWRWETSSLGFVTNAWLK